MGNINNSQKNANRNANLDMLRLVAMFMIVVLHSQTFGIFQYGVPTGFNLFIFYFIRNLSMVASNCFVLISGYFLILSEYKLEKVLFFVYEVSFYSCIIYGILVGFTELTFSFDGLVHAAFVLFYGSYWFATLYFVLYLVIPYVNSFLLALSKPKMKQMMLMGILIFSIGDMLFSLPILGMNSGYSLMSFLLLYSIGAYIALHVETNKLEPRWLFFNYVNISLGLTAYFYFFNFQEKLSYYHSPFVIGSSVCLFLFFLSSPEKLSGITRWSPYVFGVYLIHENIYVRTLLWEKWFPLQEWVQSSFVNVFLIFLDAVIFICCLLLSLFFFKIKNRLFK